MIVTRRGVFKGAGGFVVKISIKDSYSIESTPRKVSNFFIEEPPQVSVSKCVFQERKAVRGDCQTDFCAENPSELGVQRKGTLGSVLVYS